MGKFNFETVNDSAHVLYTPSSEMNDNDIDYMGFIQLCRLCNDNWEIVPLNEVYKQTDIDQKIKFETLDTNNSNFFIDNLNNTNMPLYQISYIAAIFNEKIPDIDTLKNKYALLNGIVDIEKGYEMIQFNKIGSIFLSDAINVEPFNAELLVFAVTIKGFEINVFDCYKWVYDHSLKQNKIGVGSIDIKASFENTHQRCDQILTNCISNFNHFLGTGYELNFK